MKKNYIDYGNIIFICYVVFMAVFIVGLFVALHVVENDRSIIIIAALVFAANIVILGVLIYDEDNIDHIFDVFDRINYVLNKKFGTLTQEVEVLDAVIWGRSVSERKCRVKLGLRDEEIHNVYGPCSVTVDPHLWKSMKVYDHVDAKCLVTRHLYSGHYEIVKAEVFSISLKR